MSCNCGASIGHPLVPKCICKPKKVRELTDEEINEVFKSIYGHNNSYINSSLFKFARAILRKASEK
jgi:hypothetical protein